MEQVLDVLRKELEDLTLGDDDATQTQHDDSSAVATQDELQRCPTRWRRKVWDLTEKPQSSLPARVSTHVIESNRTWLKVLSHRAHCAALP